MSHALWCHNSLQCICNSKGKNTSWLTIIPVSSVIELAMLYMRYITATKNILMLNLSAANRIIKTNDIFMFSESCSCCWDLCLEI